MMTMSMCLTLIKSPKHMQTRRHKKQSTMVHNIHQLVFNDNTTNTYTVQYNTTITCKANLCFTNFNDSQK